MTLTTASCKNIDPNPEKTDPIFSDLVQELDLFKKQEESAIKELNKARNELSKITPQTGKLQSARDKVSSMENSLDSIKQRRKYFEIKLEQRKITVAERYQESRKPGGRPWPDEDEIKDYRIRMKLQRDVFEWDKKKKKDDEKLKNKDVPRGTNAPDDKTK